ncbi:unnamed protein product [Phytophthora fragariaefolia]|uniref:Unnamed protein product n=1 Tax=Phytophthora fragariaefolia TaxID=1490495 RepID=A0A9W6XE05_9STRA|nr:unnamed protein product [Phytophthora fragariaefolia]
MQATSKTIEFDGKDSDDVPVVMIQKYPESDEMDTEPRPDLFGRRKVYRLAVFRREGGSAQPHGGHIRGRRDSYDLAVPGGA